MGNLTSPKKSFFFSSLTAKDMGIYTGTAKGRGNTNKYLVLKKQGLEIEYVSPAVSKVVFEQPHAGSKKCQWLQLSNVFNGSYEYGIEITNKRQKPGVGSQYFQERKFYGSTNFIVPSSGLIPDANLEQREREIIRQIYLDKTISSNPGASVEARRVYKLINTGAGAHGMGFTITWYSSETGLATGTTYVYLENTQTTTADVIAEINTNANLNTKVEAYQGNSTNLLYIRSKNNGDLFTLGTAVYCTFDQRYIELRSKTTDVQYQVYYPDNTASLATHYEVSFDTTGISPTTGLVTIHSVAAGTASHVTIAGASLATVVSGLEAIAGISATGIGTRAIAWGDSTVTGLDYDLLFNAAGVNCIGKTTVLKTPNLMGTGKYPFLTSAEVYSEFATKGNNGDLSDLTQTDKPQKDVDYVKYIFTTQNTIYENITPNGLIAQEQSFSIYIPKAILTTGANLWDSAGYMWDVDSPNFVANKTWLEFLAIWS